MGCDLQNDVEVAGTAFEIHTPQSGQRLRNLARVLRSQSIVYMLAIVKGAIAPF